jgi:predicted RNA binding protein YcfA (HicA-like mRNA interferase family)
MNSKDAIRMLEADGWCLVKTKGSHHHFKHPRKTASGDSAAPYKLDLPIGTLKSLLKSAGL